MKYIVLASFILTGCINLQPGDVSRILDRLEAQIDKVTATPTPYPRGWRPTPPEIKALPTRFESPMPAPGETAKP